MTDSVDIKQLKKEALEFFGPSGPASGVLERFEEAANRLFKENPCDIYGFLANYFKELAFPPKINKIEAQVCLDCRGLPTTSIDVYFSYNNLTKLVTTFESPISFQFPPLNPDELFDENHWMAVNQSVECINCFVSNVLTNLCPSFQNIVDNAIREYFCNRLNECVEPKVVGQLNAKPLQHSVINTDPESNKSKDKSKDADGEKSKDKNVAKKDNNRKSVLSNIPYYIEPKTAYPSCMLGISAVSQSICQAASMISNLSLYEHINYAFTQQNRETYQLTTPIFTILSSGKTSIGKVKCCKEFLLIPSPKRPLNQVIWEINRIYNYCWKNLNSKSSTSMSWSISDNGSLNAALDKVEQGIDILQEAIEAIGLKPSEDYFIGINAVAAEYYNPEKDRYEPLQGTTKSGSEMSKFWSDLVNQYPSFIYLVDPLIKMDKEHWLSLCDEISNRCFVVGGQVFEWANEMRANEDAVKFPASAIELKINDFDTVSDIYYAAQKFQDCGKLASLVYSLGDANSSFIIDLALALGCSFVRVGGLNRGEKTLKINRMIQTRDELIKKGKGCMEYTITFIKICSDKIEPEDMMPTKKKKVPTATLR